MNKLIDVDNFEKRLWIEYKKTKNSYISSGIALVLGMLNDEPTCTEQELEVLNQLRERVELEKLGYPPSADYYKAIMKVLKIIDKATKEYSK